MSSRIIVYQSKFDGATGNEQLTEIYPINSQRKLQNISVV